MCTYIAVDLAVKVRKYNESPTKEAELFIKRLCERTETDAVKFEGVSSIPIEWIERGLDPNYLYL